MKTSCHNFKQAKYTCYYSYLSMSSVFALPPMLFLTFRESFGISYTLLGTLVLVNFCTQLAIDLIFTFFTKYFNIHKTVRTMPVLTTVGLLVYTLIPTVLPEYAYAGLLLGTVIFSVAAGLSEVLLSPLVAAIPSENPERDMSKLHSLFAYGVVSVVLISSVFFHFFGTENWAYLTAFFSLLPLGSAISFSLAPLPEVKISHDAGASGNRRRRTGLLLCVLCIFLGSAAENTMTNWVSGYMESALQIPKAVGDLLGMASFAILLGLGRSLYAKYGRSISKVLLWSMAGAALCYLLAGLSNSVIICLPACILTGLCTAMLWPGSLILMEEHFPAPGVTAYALMAAGGDFGGSIAPQLLGIVVDTVSESSFAIQLSGQLSMTPDQIGMKAGMLTASVFPILGFFLLLYLRRYFRKNHASN